MKISLIVEKRQLKDQNALIPQVARLLSDWGVVVKPIVPETCYFNLAHIQPTADLYLLASNSPLALSLAGMLSTMGAALVNPYPIANALHNKLIALRTLQAHGLPIPETYAITDLAQITELLMAGPLIINPQSSTQPQTEASPEHLIFNVRELPTAVTPYSPLVAQRCFVPYGRQWMIHCIGGHVLGMAHRQPAHRDYRQSFARQLPAARGDKLVSGSYHNHAALDAGSPSPAELAELALRCGQVFDIDLFSIKVMEHEGVLYVLDMLHFPDGADEPEAAQRLAEYLYARAQFLTEEKRAPQMKHMFDWRQSKSLASPNRLASVASLGSMAQLM